MKGKIVLLLKVVVLISTLLLSMIAVCYVLDVFPDETARLVLPKTMAIIGIVTGASLVTVLVSGKTDGSGGGPRELA